MAEDHMLSINISQSIDNIEMNYFASTNTYQAEQAFSVNTVNIFQVGFCN